LRNCSRSAGIRESYRSATHRSSVPMTRRCYVRSVTATAWKTTKLGAKLGNRRMFDWLFSPKTVALVDESQCRKFGGYNGDRPEKGSIEHGLPWVQLDNRPSSVRWVEFWGKCCFYMPETEHRGNLEGRLWSRWFVWLGRRSRNLCASHRWSKLTTGEIKDRVDLQAECWWRTTLTKQDGGDSTEYLQDQGIGVRHSHSKLTRFSESWDSPKIWYRGYWCADWGESAAGLLILPEVSYGNFDADKEGFFVRGAIVDSKPFGKSSLSCAGASDSYMPTTSPIAWQKQLRKPRRRAPVGIQREARDRGYDSQKNLLTVILSRRSGWECSANWRQFMNK